MRSGTTRPRGGGFTLVELLVVMTILMILGAILLPWIAKAVQRGTSVGSSAFLSSAAQATRVFHSEKGYFPGQKDPGQLVGSGGTYTGSQVLAARLFGYSDGDISSSSPSATSPYLEYKAHLLLPGSNAVTAGKNNSLADASKTPPTRCFTGRRAWAGRRLSSAISGVITANTYSTTWHGIRGMPPCRARPRAVRFIPEPT